MPPGIGFTRAQRIGFDAPGQIPGLLRRHVGFAMDFLGVLVLAEIFQQRVGRLDLADCFCPEKHGQGVLPKVMEELDIALYLGRRRIFADSRLRIRRPAPDTVSASGVWG